jgi:CHASE2 domain-containing sensor protein
LTDPAAIKPLTFGNRFLVWGRLIRQILKRRGVESTLLHILAFAICLTLYSNNVSGLNSATQVVSADVLNLIFANAYPTARRDDIVVVVATDADIDHFADQFPISYNLHELVLARLASLQPKAVLVDFVFAREQMRSDKSDPERFAAFLRDYPAPLFLATGAVTAERPHGVHPNFEAGHLVAVPRFLNLSRRGIYCFYHRETIAGDVQGSGIPGCTEESSGAGVKPTAALAIYDMLCSGEHPDRICPADRKLRPLRDGYLRLIWGGIPSQLFDFLSDDRECKRTPWWETMRPDDETVAADCPYHPQIIVLELLSAANDRALRDKLANAIRGKVVMYGGFVGPSPDVIRPPTVRGIPGVHMHAMALDNLLTYGDDYKSDSTRIAGKDIPAGSMNMIFMLVAYLLALARDSRVKSTGGKFDVFTTSITVATFAWYALFCWFSFVILNLAPSNWVGAALTTVILPAMLRNVLLKIRVNGTALYRWFFSGGKTT